MSKKNLDADAIRALATTQAGIGTATTKDDDAKPVTAAKKAAVTFRLDGELVGRTKAAAFWTRASISAVVTDALVAHLAKLEKANGEPFPRPGAD